MQWAREKGCYVHLSKIRNEQLLITIPSRKELDKTSALLQRKEEFGMIGLDEHVDYENHVLKIPPGNTSILENYSSVHNP
uniref:DUF2007 domain-containing protein n=1 Tax=Syphacia muris TaxID=451379 RepID=A0A0N5AYG8_9BILA